MSKNIFIVCFLVFNMFFLSTGCQDSYEEVLLRDIIQEYNVAQKLPLTTHIDFTGDFSEEFLIAGWSDFSENQGWSDGVESQLRFIAKKGTAITMRLYCRPVIENAVPQTIDVSLNAHFIERLTLDPQKKQYALVLPNEYLQDEVNMLTFKYGYTTSPCEMSDSAECRQKLAVVFRRIEFDIGHATDNKIALIDDKIRQPPDTFFNYYAVLPQKSILHFDILRSHTKLRGLVKISADGIAPQIYQFDRDGKHQIDLANLANMFVKISVWCESREQNAKLAEMPGEQTYIEWSNVRLLALQEWVAKENPQNTYEDIQSFQERLRQYDVIYIVFDAFHAKHSSLYGYSKKTTPFLDELAKESLVFENMFANAPYTLASTGTLFTSTYLHEHGLITKEDRLKPVLPTINEVLVDSGIETCLITGHGFLGEPWGLLRGFSTIFKDAKYSRDTEDASIDALKQIYALHPNKRKFLYLHFGPPHFPYAPPEQFKIFTESKPKAFELTQEVYNRLIKRSLQVNEEQLAYIISLYDANILFADNIAKDLFAYLEESELIKRCIVIITSDHGEAFMEHGQWAHGSTVFDEMIHIPFLMHFPEELHIPPRKIEHIVSLIDIAPTLADIYGIEGQLIFLGTSLLPLIVKNIPIHSFIYAETLAHKARTVRDLKYKYILSPQNTMFFDVSHGLEQHNLLNEYPVTAGYYAQLIKPFLSQDSNVAANDKVDINTLDKDTIQNLRELGYIK